eukprot:scaffold23084_cov33-Tisochrysis_lutea.AAC.5
MSPGPLDSSPSAPPWLITTPSPRLADISLHSGIRLLYSMRRARLLPALRGNPSPNHPRICCRATLLLNLLARVETHRSCHESAPSLARCFFAGWPSHHQGAALDDNLRASLTSSLVNCWLGLRLELLGAIISAAAAALAFARNAAAGSGIMNAGLRGAGGVGTAALGVTLALQVNVGQPA